jgi:hypothetical protein
MPGVVALGGGAPWPERRFEAVLQPRRQLGNERRLKH